MLLQKQRAVPDADSILEDCPEVPCQLYLSPNETFTWFRGLTPFGVWPAGSCCLPPFAPHTTQLGCFGWLPGFGLWEIRGRSELAWTGWGISGSWVGAVLNRFG